MNNISKILIASASGMLAGIVLGILIAPDKGSETIKKIKDQPKKIVENLQETLSRVKEKFSPKQRQAQSVNEEVGEFA